MPLRHLGSRMSPLLTILLATSSARGEHIVFRWPRKVRYTKSSLHVKYYRDVAGADLAPHADDYADESDSVSDSDAASSLSESSILEGPAPRGREEDSPRLGPREHPSSVHSRSASRARRGRYSPSAVEKRKEELRTQAFGTFLGFDIDMLASMLIPRVEECNKRFEFVIEDLLFLGYPVVLEPPASSRNEHRHSEFNLVMVFNRAFPYPMLPDTDAESWMRMFYGILFKLTAVLVSEELRNSYVSREARTLLQIRESFLQNGVSYRNCLHACLDESSLARLLRDTFRLVVKREVGVVHVNNLPVRLNLPLLLLNPAKAELEVEKQAAFDLHDPIMLRGDGPEPRDPSALTFRRGALCLSDHETSLQCWTRSNGPFLLPWKTLLLPRQPNGIAAEVAEHARPLVDCFVPGHWLTFAQAADSLGWDLYRKVYPVVRHLIYFSGALVVDVPRIQSLYKLDPTFDLVSQLPTLSQHWSLAFPRLMPLPFFLEIISSALRPFVVHCRSLPRKTPQLDVLVWLLQHGILLQIHMHLRLCVTARDQQRAVQLRRARIQHSLMMGLDTEEPLLIDVVRSEMEAGTKEPERPVSDSFAQKRHSRTSSVDSSMSSMDEWKASRMRLSETSHVDSNNDDDDGDDEDILDDILPHGTPTSALIAEPTRASRIETEWISAMLEGKHPWYIRWMIRLFPYLNGKHTVDEILAREHLSHRDLKLIIAAFDSNLLQVYHE